MIVIESLIRLNKKYCPQKLLEECKYITKNNKIENLINDDLDQNLKMNGTMDLIIDLTVSVMIDLLKVKSIFW